MLWEMANFSPTETGLSHFVYVSPKNSSHGCRVKVSNIKGKYAPNDVFSVTVPNLTVVGNEKVSQDELHDIKDWIVLNKDVILKYWHQKISTTELVSKLEKI